MVNVQIKKLVDNAVIPFKATSGSAAFDLVATSVKYDDKNDCWVYGLGFSTEFPEDWVAHIFPRSSNRKTDYYIPNSPCTIDADYRGEWMICFKSRDFTNLRIPPYEVGDKIAQMKMCKVYETVFNEVENLSDSVRGDGSFGSTGK